ncbi:MAG TPA: class I SAM-dependent methyltransferase [Flavipsychrobacter sp.]|nr:class I SAM-dependent methyltransferase [Flavipsychrobacter sp.]
MAHGTEFQGIAGLYSDYRPSYPAAMIDAIARYTGIDNDAKQNGAVIIDVGSGTGISTRLLRERFDAAVTVLGLEPNDDMYTTAVSFPGSYKNLAYLHCAAEDLPFKDNTVSGVMAAQAVQWFNRPMFYKEVSRVLRPNGFFALLQNNRDWESDAFLAAYEELLEKYSPGYSRHYRSFDLPQEMKSINGMTAFETHNDSWKRTISKDDFLGFAMSSTKVQAAMKNAGAEYIKELILQLIKEQTGDSNTFKIAYKTELFLVRKM